MNNLTKFLILLVPILSLIAAAVLLYFDKEGWGWFIFITLMTAHDLVIKRNKDETN